MPGPEEQRPGRLERVVAAPPGRPTLEPDRRPIREVTRQVAFDPGAWTPERAARVVELFDGLAPDWNSRAGVRTEAVADALARGGPFPPGPVLEIGSGTGVATPLVAAALGQVVSVDLSPGMLALAPHLTPQVRADAAVLPFPAGAAAVVVLVNMFLFPAEVDRVLRPDGVVVWVNTLGDETPIHLPAGDVVAALPGAWDAVTADAGWGTWATVRRAPDAQPARSSGSTSATNSSSRPQPSDGQLHTR